MGGMETKISYPQPGIKMNEINEKRRYRFTRFNVSSVYFKLGDLDPAFI